MSRSWREWKSPRVARKLDMYDKNGDIILRKWNRKDRRGTVGHCCKYHHDMDAYDYDKERDLREGKKEHLREIHNALRRCI